MNPSPPMVHSGTRAARYAVYVVDDHPVVRAGLKSMFEDYPLIEWAGAAPDATTALRELAELASVVVLVDLRLPDRDGCALCRELKLLRHPPRVLVLTSFGDEADMVAAFAAGADGYVLKTSADDVLVAAIVTVATGGTVWPSALPLARPHGPGAAGSRSGGLDLLSPQELRVLARLADGKTNKEIALSFGVSEKTVRNQVSHLMRKLRVDRRAHAAACYVKWTLLRK